MTRFRSGLSAIVAPLICVLMGAAALPAKAQSPLKVCATIPDLGSLCREVGGDQVSVTVFCNGPSDPHFLEAKPSFIKATSEADVFLELGLEMEVGYVPVLLGNARNSRVLVNAPGFVDASRAIEPLEIPSGSIDRSQGDVHGRGNPHYLLDPLNGLRVAGLLRDKLTEFRPEKKEYFATRYADFRKRLGVALLGEKLAEKYAAEYEKLALLAEHGKLGEFLKGQGEEKLLGGWLGAMLPYYGAKYADEHNLWVYLAHRYGLQNVGHMEPVPGVQPTTKQLGVLIEKMRAEKVLLILHTPYYDAKHARFVADQTGAKTVAIAHQVGAIAGTDEYLSMMDANVRAIAGALGGKP